VIDNARNEVRNEEACGAINTHKLGVQGLFIDGMIE